MKKGFTLIELLAVIVILAIIALIATPIVLNIISDTKESASLRSAEFYLDAVEFSVANLTLDNNNIEDGTYGILENGNICLEYDEDDNCIDTLEVKVKGEKPNSGTITITNGEIGNVDILLNNDRIVTNSEGNVIYFPCTLISGDKNTNGSKYECEVKPGVKYNFYVLSQNSDGTTNLILDRNVYYNGTTGESGLTDENNKGLVAWNSSRTNTVGPLTAMTYLYNATKDWINIPALNYTYEDKTFQGTTKEDRSYISFISIDGIATITPLSGNVIVIGSEKSPLKARMPTSGNSTKIEVAQFNNNNGYLYENLDGGSWQYGESTKPTNNISGIYGYWTLSSYGVSGGNAWNVRYSGVVYHNEADNGSYSGVRPVINIRL